MPLHLVERITMENSAKHLRTWLATALALLATAWMARPALAMAAPSDQNDDLRALGGEWLYVEDRTEGRAIEEQGPPMSVKFALRIEQDAVIMVRGTGARAREERIPIDGSVGEEEQNGSRSRRRGAWQNGVLEYEVESVRVSDNQRTLLIRREFRVTADGMQVRVVVDPPDGRTSVALYRHPNDIALPAPKQAVIADLAWLCDAWVGTRGSRSIEERWSPPLGGAMLGVSRTVSQSKMVAFEFLRIVERDAGLVYIAQPGGAAPTEFVLVELDTKRAVFENPRHDHPQRIVYELSAKGGLSASIGFVKGGRPQRFEFLRESK